MRRMFVASILFFAAASHVQGQDATTLGNECGHWSASVSMVGDGAFLLNTSACSVGMGPAADIQILCSGPELYIRIGLQTDASDLDYTGQTKDLMFAANGTELQIPLIYEALDGAFTTVLASDHPFIEIMRAGTELRISDPLNHIPEHRIPLMGFQKAIDTMIASCR